MSLDAYINPDFGWMEKSIFLIAALVGVMLCAFLIILGAKLSRSERASFYDKAGNRIQQFYELIISGTSVMSFSCAYVILNHIYSILNGQTGTFVTIWGNWKDFALLLLICLSCVLNTILDKFIIPLKLISKEEKASIRMLSMFYAIILLVYLNYIGDESEYNPVMMYYLGLMIGRFVYFDASFSDFIDALKALFRNIPLLALGLILTGSLSYFGFSSGYLLERNYYIVGIFYTQLTMLAAVFIIHHSHIFSLIICKPDDAEAYDETPKKSVDDPDNDYFSDSDYDAGDELEDYDGQ